LAAEANLNVPILPIKKLVRRVETITGYTENIPSFGGSDEALQ
jgi:hypothetical protein